MAPPTDLRLDGLLTFRGVIAAALAYAALNAALSLAAGPALALDDVKLNVLTQSLQGGYLPDNPPLFEWTLYGAQLAFGPTLGSFVGVKSIYLVLTAAFAFLAAREAGADDRAAATAALALPLIPQFGWSFHQTLTHSTALFAATAFFWFALLRLQRRRRILDFGFLGVAIGVGSLSKYSFLLAASAAFLAAILHPLLRKALLSPRLIAAAIAAGAVTAPHLLWAVGADHGSASLIHDRLADAGGHASRAAKGLLSLSWATLSYMAPLTIVAIISLRERAPEIFSGRRDVLAEAALIALLALAAVIALLGVSNFQERYAIPFLFPAFLSLILRLNDLGKPMTALVASLSVVTAFTGARVLEIARPGAPFCQDCRQYVPYTELRDALARKAAERATLAGFDDHTAGNLRRLFPGARVISTHQPFYTPPSKDPADDCYFIWSTDLSPAPDPSAIDQLDRSKIERIEGRWDRVMKGESEARTTTWNIARIEQDRPIGAALCRP